MDTNENQEGDLAENRSIVATSDRADSGGEKGGSLIGTLIADETGKSPNYLVQHVRINHAVPSPKPGSMVAVKAQTIEGEDCFILDRKSVV
jgi:hypothetical protein